MADRRQRLADVVTATRVPYANVTLEIHIRDALPDGEFPPQKVPRWPK